MIAAVGKPNITLKRLMLDDGFPHLNNYSSRGRSVAQELNGVFNCSYTPPQMREYVYRRWSWLRDDLPIINETIIGNKLEAQRKMHEEISEHILVSETTSPPENGEWILKPYASQGGAGIRVYSGGRIPSGFYIQQNANKLREFRAHVGLWLSNPVFTIQEKKPKPELWEEAAHLNPGEYHWPIRGRELRGFFPLTWNIESGFYFRRTTTPDNRRDKVRRFPLLGRIEEVAIKAVKALSYQFGAVDILMDEERQLWVTEVNSHPAIINEESKRVYLQALEPLKEISKIDLFNLTQQTASNLTQRTFVRGGGFV